MITQEDAKSILLLEFVNDVQLLQVIQRYIFDCKGVNVNTINRPNNQMQLILMNTAIESCLKYYVK